MRRGVLAGGVLAVLWFVCSWAPWFLSSAGGSLATLGRLIPSPTGRGVFGSPVGWALLVQVLMVLVLVVGFAALARLLSRRGASFAAGWLSAVLVAFAIGAVLDLGNFLVWAGPFGIRGALGTMGAAAESTWWAVVVGWVPGLIWMLQSRRAEQQPSRGVLGWAALAAVALIALPFAAQAGHDATQDRLREEQSAAQTQADPDGAAAPDPDAAGEPVPTVAPADGPPVEGACTVANTTILAPAPDGATGHRGQAISLVNVSDEPCTVEGYPDVAYGDQNEHLLDVTVEHGSSFMAGDPGATPVTLQPGESARAVIGWDANSVNGQLAARHIWIAVAPGEQRLTWDMPLDIVPGATVSVTAWAPQEVPAG